MAFSNKFGYLVLTTGNKSEMAVGYCTLYGDMSGGLAVIGDVPKTMVYEIARYINREREIIPESTLTKPPSAELRPNQTDQDTLPPYEVLDAILELYLEEGKSSAEIVAAGLRSEDGRVGAADGGPQRVQALAGRARAEGHVEGLRRRLAHADCGEVSRLDGGDRDASSVYPRKARSSSCP